MNHCKIKLKHIYVYYKFVHTSLTKITFKNSNQLVCCFKLGNFQYSRNDTKVLPYDSVRLKLRPSYSKYFILFKISWHKRSAGTVVIRLSEKQKVGCDNLFRNQSLSMIFSNVGQFKFPEYFGRAFSSLSTSKSFSLSLFFSLLSPSSLSLSLFTSSPSPLSSPSFSLSS